VSDRAYREQQLARQVAWVIVAAGVLAAVVGSVVADRLSVPIRLLTQATARISAGRFSERVPGHQRDEVGELARQFNLMAQRLEESFAAIATERDRLAEQRDQLRQFVSDVSHELRTPLTALRTFNDLLQDGAGEHPGTRQEFLRDSARQIERLDWLTHNLLDLSRLDAGLAHLTTQRVNLVDTIQRAIEANKPAAAAKEITLVLSAQPTVMAHDAQRMEQALSNLVGNAIKFSHPASRVDISVSVDGQHAVVDVRDQGIGILPSELPHIFERFYRGFEANRSGDGSGLGLAITKAIVEAHCGTVEVASTPGHGTTMRLRMPLDGETAWIEGHPAR
jgi:signal transduction histidine kinase